MGTTQTTFSVHVLSQCLLFMHKKAAPTATEAGKLCTRGSQCRQANRPGRQQIHGFTSGMDGVRACCM